MKKGIIFLITLVLLFSFSMTAFAAPKDMGNGEMFDAEYYANTYADVKAALGTDEKVLYDHYVQFGKAEGRLPMAPTTTKTPATTTKEAFDAKFYADTYPDLKAAFGYDETALYNHYIQSGKAEGRIATPTAQVKQQAKTTIASATDNTQLREDRIVYITRYGKKYHYDKECAGNITFERALEQAQKTHGPCKTCVLQ